MKKIIDYILLVLYTLCFYTLWQLCQWGGVRSHLRRLLPLAVLLLITLIVKLVLRHKGFRAPHARARVAAFAGITALFGGLIVYSAVPYHGQLSWKIDDLPHHKKVEFTHTNLYTDGVEGILTDVKTKLALPEKLYISNSFSAEFTADGTITSVDTMLYGENEQGEMETYLISYNAKHGTSSMYGRTVRRIPRSTLRCCGRRFRIFSQKRIPKRRCAAGRWRTRMLRSKFFIMESVASRRRRDSVSSRAMPMETAFRVPPMPSTW